MAYSELIKSFAKIREYMNQFYVYGFKSRSEYTAKSARSYDNERRRIESWIGDYMSFSRDSNGKRTFISVDSRNISHNPLYKAFKAKSFTDNDIMLHFYILDILADGCIKSIREIADTISSDYLSVFDDDYQIDESTVRKKLKEYERRGIITSEKTEENCCLAERKIRLIWSHGEMRPLFSLRRIRWVLSVHIFWTNIQMHRNTLPLSIIIFCMC